MPISAELLIRNGLFPETLPSVYTARAIWAALPVVATPFAVTGPAVGQLCNYDSSKRGGLRRMFAVPHPLFIRDQGVFFERHWTTLEACFAAAALAALREGLDTADATGEHFWDAELHRLTGTVLLAENKLDEGQASLQQAISTAQTQQAKSLELRAATSLTRFWGEQGRRAEARDLLAPVYGWFTEGFDTADLKEAKALLDHLA